MNRQTNAAALRQVTVGLRLGAISHDDAVGILESLIDAYELHEAANRCRARRAKEEYLSEMADPYTAPTTADLGTMVLDPLPEECDALVEAFA